MVTIARFQVLFLFLTPTFVLSDPPLCGVNMQQKIKSTRPGGSVGSELRLPEDRRQEGEPSKAVMEPTFTVVAISQLPSGALSSLFKGFWLPFIATNQKTDALCFCFFSPWSLGI